MKKNDTKWQVAVSGMVILFLFCTLCMFLEQGAPKVGGIRDEIQETVGEKITGIYSPALLFVRYAGEEEGFTEGIRQSLLLRIPLYAYMNQKDEMVLYVEDTLTEALILENEGRDEYYEDTLQEAMELENELEASKAQNEPPVTTNPETESVEFFVEALEKKQIYKNEDLYDYTFLLENFYVVDSATSANARLISAQNFMETDMRLNSENEGYQILIYHTHSTEAFADSVPGESADTVVGMGAYLKQLLEEKYGFRVLHHTGAYDVENRDYAYSYAAPALESLLSEHPEIEVVIDLHRDGVAEGRHLVTDLNGRQTAQIMFFNGLSYTNAVGQISYLENPYLKENLALSFQMQLAANEYYPGLTRKIYLKGYRYNMHYRPKTMLVEMGAQTNTVQEIKNACEPFAHLLSLVLQPQ